MIIRVSRATAALKPPHGAPCTRCGLCCQISLCPLAQRVLNRPEFPGPCPALLGTPGNASCGLIAEPEKYAPALSLDVAGADNMRAAAALLIGSGDGCDARINGEPVNHAFYAKLARQDIENAEAVNLARDLWHV